MAARLSSALWRRSIHASRSADGAIAASTASLAGIPIVDIPIASADASLL
jgi:hypothetical protein